MVGAMAYGLAVMSAVCNATFFAPNRLESVKKADIHPFVYNWYTTMGVFTFSWVIALFLPSLDLPYFQLVPAGVIAGADFTMALCFSCLALPLLGLSIAMGVWCSMAILVSFAWGTIGPANIAHALVSVPMSLVAIGMIVLGCIGIIYVDDLGNALFCEKQNKYVEMIDDGIGKVTGSASAAAKKALGIFYAICVGCFGGSMLVPLSFVPPELAGIKGLAFVPSFGIGSLLAGTSIMALYWALGACGAIKRDPIKLEPRATLWAGLTSGTIWQFGNVCQVVAQSFYGLPYAIAYPIFQASLVMAGLLGVVVFNEITGQSSVTAFFVSATVVVTGSVLLAQFGPV